jgi:hypothetical protein
MRRLVLLCLAPLAALGLGLAYLASKTFDAGPSADYQFIWLAGLMWADGIDPYTQAYHALAEEMFPDGRVPHAWYYPPNWWPVATAMARLPFEASLEAWRILSSGALILSCILVTWATVGLTSTRGFATFAALAAGASLFSATPIFLSLGQTSVALILGMALTLVALVRRSRVLAALGVVLLMLKPQLGLPVSIFLLMSPYWWPSLLAAAAATLAAAAPAVALPGLPGFLSAYLEIISGYDGHGPAHPANMTGLRTLVFAATGVSGASLVHIAVACGAAAVLGALHARRDSGALLFAMVALLAFLVPLHLYDLTFLVMGLAFLPSLSSRDQRLVAILCLPLIRANNLERVLGLSLEKTTFATGSFLASLALAGLALLGAAQGLHAARALLARGSGDGAGGL